MPADGPPRRSCWADGPERVVKTPGRGPWYTRLKTIGSTCLLPDGHPGPHHWTPDDRLVIRFSEESP